MADAESAAEAPAASASSAVTAAETSPPLHATRLSSLLESGKYSDLTLQCGTRHWKVHKSVLCIQSDFFAKACDGDFKAGSATSSIRAQLTDYEIQEAHTNEIDLSNDNEHAVAAMIHFMYHGSYDASSILPGIDQEARAMLLHVRIVGLSQKYFIEPLQEFAMGRAIQAMDNWGGVPSTFAEAVFEIYTGTVDVDVGAELRQTAVAVAMANATILFSEDDTEEDHHTREILLDETPGFVGDWATAMAKYNSTQASSIEDLTTVNGVLNGDNNQLNANLKKLNMSINLLKTRNDILMKQAQSLSAEMPVTPTLNGLVNYDIAAMRCYKCPNCESKFFKILGRSFQHQCYQTGWTGKLGKTGVSMS